MSTSRSAGRRLSLDQLRQDTGFTVTVRDEQLSFTTTWGLFSPRELDRGSRLLLDRVIVNPDDDCLDIGCGYGAIGVTLAKLAPAGQTLMVDKDFVAVEYAAKNIVANGLTNAEARLSNSLSAVEAGRQFDLVVANLPARVGNEMLTLMIGEAREVLRPGGRFYAVHLTGMRQFIRRVVRDVFDDYEKLQQGRDYTLVCARVGSGEPGAVSARD